MLILKNIRKTYPGVVALDDVSMSVRDGEVHALMGENGAGKSTLIKIIAGAVAPDRGEICFDEKTYPQMTPHIAQENGVAVIYQELNLCAPLTVAENIYLGRPQAKLYSQRQVNRLAQEIFDEYGFDLEPGAVVASLPPAKQQLVEICKGISMGAKIMIMDEPTSSLATAEVELLFRVIRKLKEKGVTIIYISHRLDEVFQVTDRITILRDGAYIATVNTADTNRQELVRLMVGRELTESYPQRSHEPGEVVLETRNLTGNSVENISFSLRKGEILGFAGLVGCGRTETAQLICGAVPAASGEILVNGQPKKIRTPVDAIRAGIGLIPEDRKEQGCILQNTVLFNTTLICNKKFVKGGVISGKKRAQVANEYKDKLKIHGGAFAFGDKRDDHMDAYLVGVKRGYAVASIEYRVSGEAPFPAAVLDCREAIRYIKSHADEYKVDANKIIVIGGSAGGNLTAMLGMNVPNGGFPGEEGRTGYSCAPNVQVCIDQFGPVRFETMTTQAIANGVSEVHPNPAMMPESKYLGCPIDKAPADLLAKAYPGTYASPAMAPMLVQHGTADHLVPWAQSEEFVADLTAKGYGDRVEYIPLEGADHEDKRFFREENMNLVFKFIEKHL